MPNVEPASNGLGIDIARVLVYDLLLGLHDGTSLALVVNSNNFTAELELATLAGDRERLQEGHLALPIDDTTAVKGGHPGNGISALVAEEIHDFLIGVLEGCGRTPRLAHCINTREKREHVRKIIGYVGNILKSGCSSCCSQATHQSLVLHPNTSEAENVRRGSEARQPCSQCCWQKEENPSSTS